jgi:hypothetical protein
MVVGWCVVVASLSALLSVSSVITAHAQGKPGVPPVDEWTCPATHPIRGNLTTRTGECIYHVRGGGFYEKTKPERCYATEEEARRDGCRRSKR